MIVTCDPIYDATTIQRIAARYQTQIDRLEAVGFLKLYLVREMLEPYSVLRYPHIVAGALAYGEPLYIEPPLRIATYTPLLVCLETACIAMIMAKGVKYYTHFIDGTVLISNNFETEAYQRPDLGCYKFGDRIDFEAAHQLHQDRRLLRHDAFSNQLGFKVARKIARKTALSRPACLSPAPDDARAS